MNLLKYEFIKSPADSFNGMLGQLVKKMRHYYYNVSSEEFSNFIPEMKLLEIKIQKIDQDLNCEPRDYMEEIMEELNAESELEDKLLEEIERSSKAIISALYDDNFSMDDFGYDFRNSEATSWIEFYGYNENRDVDGSLLVVKEVFRSVCYKYGIIFIDSTLGKE